MNQALLSQLKNSQGQWIEPRALARSLEISVHLLEREIDSMVQQGYRIDSDPLDGVRLLSMPDGLVAHEIAWELGTEVVGRRIIVEQEVASTNDFAWRQVKSAGWSPDIAKEINGLVVIARRQTAGRGRLGRAWASPEGGLWMSLVLRSPSTTLHRPLLTIAGAVAVADAIRQSARLEARIRWPNDVTIANRKVAGVLVEEQSAFPHVYVLGVGVNVDVREEDLPTDVRTSATSLRCELSCPVSITLFARALLSSLDRWNAVIQSGDHGELNNSWRSLASTLGQRTAITVDGKRYEGVVVELDLFGGISLRFDRGGVRAFRSEEVRAVEVLE